MHDYANVGQADGDTGDVPSVGTGTTHDHSSEEWPGNLSAGSKSTTDMLLRQAERSDRLDELEKIGVPADSNTRQHNPAFRGAGVRYAPESQ
jgi:hypothetical protein